MSKIPLLQKRLVFPVLAETLAEKLNNRILKSL